MQLIMDYSASHAILILDLTVYRTIGSVLVLTVFLDQSLIKKYCVPGENV